MASGNSSNPGNSGGTGQSQQGYSLSAFLTSLVTNAIIWTIEIGLFIVLRNLFKRIYQPRTFVETVPERKRVEPLPSTPWGWIPKLLTTPTHLVIEKSGLDGYFLLRYLRMMIILFVASMLVIWPILLPINAVNQRGADEGITGMDLLSISNVKDANRYWAHVFVAIAFVCATCWLMYHELKAFVRIRQENLTSDDHKDTVRATTILVTSIPANFLDVKTLRQVFSVFPGGVRNVFLNRDCSELLESVEQRDSIARMLESAETDLIKMAAKADKKTKAKQAKEAKKRNANEEVVELQVSTSGVDHGSVQGASQGYLVDKYVPKKKRPTHRLPLASWMPSLPFIGKKVDTIKWAREELTRMNPAIARDQARPERYDALNSAFIQFNTQLAAHMACQSVASHKPMYMTPRYIETAPEDVVWDNMQLVWWQRLIRVYSINAAIIALIVFYAIPTAFVGSISNITYLTNLLPWLRFIYNLPSQLLGLITGLLPSVMLAIWLALLPFILRIACKLQGHPTRTVIELTVQTLYFAFLVIQVFLVVSIASSSTAVVTQIIQNPTNVATLLASNLPKSSNFFFSYLLLQGLSVSAGTLLQIVILSFYYIFGKLFNTTPRKKWRRFNTLPGLGWGTTYPVFTNLAVIGITYSVIAPLIILFVITTFSLFYFTYLHNFLYVYEFTTDTGGLAFPKAIYQTMTGIYFAEICLIGLFFITSGARPQGIVMVVVLVLTILFQIKLASSFDPLITYLPIDIQEELMSQVREQKLDEGRKPDEEAEFQGQRQGEEGLGDTTSVPRMSSIPSEPPQIGKLALESSRPSPQEGEFEDSAKLDTTSNHPATQSDIRRRPSIKSRVRKINDKFSIPGLSKKKKIDMDDDNDDLDTDLQRKFTHELTHEELVAIAFQHEALRARPPILWIPNDELGIAQDEIEHTKRECGEDVAITCEGARLDSKGRIVWEGKPPDYVAIPAI